MFKAASKLVKSEQVNAVISLPSPTTLYQAPRESDDRLVPNDGCNILPPSPNVSDGQDMDPVFVAVLVEEEGRTYHGELGGI